MKNTVFFRIVAGLATSLLLFAASSCVNNEYTLEEENIDTNVTLFKEGICVPLGTAHFSLGAMLEKYDLTEKLGQYLQEAENGAYSFSYGPETMDMSESLEALNGAVEVGKIDFSRSIEFSLEGVNVDGIRYEGQSYGFDKDISGDVSGLDVKIPDIDSPFVIDAKLRDFNLGNISWDLNLGDKQGAPNFATLPESLTVPQILLTDALRDVEMPISELSSYLSSAINFNHSIEDITFETVLKNSFPKEVLSVSEINVAEGAKVRISVSLNDPFLKSGKIIPYLDIDLSSILKIKDSENNHIASDFTLSDENDWTSVQEFSIEGLVIDAQKDWIYPDPNDPQSVLHIDKTVTVSLDGSLSDENLKTTPGILADWIDRHPAEGGKRDLDISVNVEFIDFTVDNVTMEIKPQEIESKEEFEITIPEIKFPSLVKSVDNVAFDPESPITFSLSVENIKKLGDLDFNVDYLELTFPDRFIVKGADENNKLKFGTVNLSEEDMVAEIAIVGYDFAEPDANGVVPAYTGIVSVSAKASVGGEIRTGNLPTSEEDDIVLRGNVGGSVVLSDFSAVLNGYEVSSETDPDMFPSEQIKIELPEALAQVSGLVVYLKDDPTIDIQVKMPQTSFAITPLGEGLSIYFPRVLNLKGEGEYLNYFDAQKHALVFEAGKPLPEHISLPVKNIMVNAEKAEDGKWYTSGEFKVAGSIGIAEGAVVTKADLDAIQGENAKIVLKASIPTLEPDVVEMDSYSTSLETSFDFAPFKGIELPDMIKTVNDVIFDDVFMSLGLTTSKDFPSIGQDAVLTLGLNMELPEFIVVEDDRFENGKLQITQDFEVTENGLQLIVDPVRISGLSLNMEPEKLGELSGTIKIDGSVVITGASLDIDQWAGKKHAIDVIADIKTCKEGADPAEEKVDIKEVQGYVDYQMSAVNVPVDLSAVVSTIKEQGLDATIDINSFYLDLGVKTNLGVHLKADMDIIRYSEGQALPALRMGLTADPAPSASEMKETRFWVSNKEPLEGSGHKFLQVDLADILYTDATKSTFVDSLHVSIAAGTDVEKLFSYDPEATYELFVDYAAGIPMEFGEDFRIEFCDTLTGFGSTVSMLFSYGSVGIGGTAESTIPLNFNAKVNLLDAAGNVIPMEEGYGEMTIKACYYSGEAVKSPLEFILGAKKGVQIPEVDAIEIIVSADASGAAGVPLRKDTDITLNLNARIPEGVTADVMELLEGDILNTEEDQQ